MTRDNDSAVAAAVVDKPVVRSPCLQRAYHMKRVVARRRHATLATPHQCHGTTRRRWPQEQSRRRRGSPHHTTDNRQLPPTRSQAHPTLHTHHHLIRFSVRGVWELPSCSVVASPLPSTDACPR